MAKILIHSEQKYINLNWNLMQKPVSHQLCLLFPAPYKLGISISNMASTWAFLEMLFCSRRQMIKRHILLKIL